jgi:hypothetical protein
MSSLEWYTIGRVGLLYDLFGALILVWGFVLQGKKEFEEAVAFYGTDEPLTPIATKIDSIVGLSFIVLGFLGQLAGTDSYAAAVFSSYRGCVIFALIFLIGGGIGYLIFRKAVFAGYLLRIKNRDNEQK